MEVVYLLKLPLHSEFRIVINKLFLANLFLNNLDELLLDLIPLLLAVILLTEHEHLLDHHLRGPLI